MHAARLRHAVVATCLVALLPVSVFYGVAELGFRYPAGAEERLEELAADPGRARMVGGLFLLTQLLALAVIPAVVTLARPRGAGLAAIGSFLLAVGIVAHAGVGGAQMSRVALAESPDRDAMVDLWQAMESNAAETAIGAVGLLGFLLGAILLSAALLRSGRVPKWIPILLWAGLIVEFGLFSFQYGSLAGLALFGTALMGLGLHYWQQTAPRNPGYVVVDVDVHDPETYTEYRAKAAPTVLGRGGRYIVRGGDVTHVEPGWDLHRFVILEFPTVAQAKEWYESPEYQEVLPIRLRSARSRLAMVEGLDPDAPLPS
jgi:uncharacterized protein (DUF1330 family)